jgi:spoIIIJ-associated protein
MTSEALQKSIQEFISTLLTHLGNTDATAKVTITEEETLDIDVIISGENVDLLIGYHGRNISALHHIVLLHAKKALGKESGKKVMLSLDVGDYYSRQNEKVIRQVEEAISDVRLLQEPYEFRPMSPRMRRLVHMEIAKHTDVKSESIGEGEERRVVIHPNNAQA